MALLAIESMIGFRVKKSAGALQLESLLLDIRRRSYLLCVVFFVAALGATTSSSSEHDFSALMRAMVHLGVKYILIWLVFSRYWIRIFDDQYLFKCFAFSYAGLAFVHLIYCILQRYIGIDWSHGVGAFLPQGRFAYGVYRISGFMGHPLTMGYCQAIAAVSCFGFFNVASTRAEKFAWLISTICAGLVVALSGSRGPQLAAALGVIASMPYLFWRRHLVRVLGAVISGAILGVYFNIFDRFFEIFQYGAGGDMRSVHWQVFWQIFVDNPIFGLGPTAPREAISAYYIALGASDNIRLAHNSWLQFAAEFGVLGLMASVYWFLGWLRFAGLMHTLRRSARGLVIAIFIGTLTQNNLQDSEFLFAIAIWGILIAVREVCVNDSRLGNARDEDLVA